jgi:parallel beta-helix repeat protein
VIENPGGADNGISVVGAPGLPLKGFTLANVTVRDFSANGVFLIAVKDFVLSHVRAEGNAGYGLYPVLSTHGLIEYSVTTGSNDSGIYVGQSADVIIRGNTAYDNVNGIEVENSSEVQTIHNVVYNNTVGILVDLLPAALVAIPGFTPVEASTHNLVADNAVFGNNRANTAPGSDHTTVRNNVVVGNAFAGIALLSGTDLLALAPGTPGYSPGVDPNPNDTLIAGNLVLGNGFYTGPVPPGFPAPADLVWTLSGKRNHWRGNLFGTSSPNNLP